RRWDLETRNETARVDLAGGGSFGLAALSPDGRLAALRVDAKLHLIDTAAGDTRLALDVAQGIRKAAVFSRDGGLLAVIGDNIRWCDTKNGTVVAALDKRLDDLRSFGLSADGLTLAVSGGGPVGNLFSVYRLDAAGKKVAQLAKDGDNFSTIGDTAVSPDGTLVAVGSKFSAAVIVCDALTGRQIARKWPAHGSPIAAMAFSPDGSHLATSDLQGTIKLWGDPRALNDKSEPKRTLKNHSGPITGLSFSSDGTLLVSTSLDKTARVWHTQEPESAVRRVASAGYCYSARFSPDGLLMALADGDRIRLWDAATGQVVRELSARDGSPVSSVAFSPDNRLLATGHGGPKRMSHVSLWEIDTGKQLACLTGASDLSEIPVQWDFGSVTAVGFTPDGKHLVACFGALNYHSTLRFSCPLKVWDVATGRLIQRLAGHQGLVVSMDFSPDGSLLASGSQDGTAIVWSTATWEAVRSVTCPDHESAVGFPITNEISSLAFSPDGKTLAMASSGGTVVLCDVATGQPRATLKGHASKVGAAAFSPDGRTLATGSEDHTFRLWNVRTRRDLLALDSAGIEPGPPRSLVFSPDGSRLLASGAHPRFWSTSPSQWDEPQRAAETLKRLLDSSIDFRCRIRMLSENLRLHEALACIDSDDPRVADALAATRANWHAAHRRWAAAAEEFDRLKGVNSGDAIDWLRTAGVARVAGALVECRRCADAAMLFLDIENRRVEDAADTQADELLATLQMEIDRRLTTDPVEAERAAKCFAALLDDAGALDARRAIMEVVNRYEGVTAALGRLRPDDPLVRSALASSHARRGASLLAERPAEAQAEFNKSRDVFTQLFFEYQKTEWTVLEPTKITSAGGATLSLLADGSILASGNNPDQDTYTIRVQPGLSQIAAIRLETLPDDTLPHLNSGRAEVNGNFNLTGIAFRRQSPTPEDGRDAIGIRTAWVDHSGVRSGGAKVGVDGMLDANDQTYWSPFPLQWQAHLAIFELDQAVDFSGAEELCVQLHFEQKGNPQHAIGRFRLSVTGGPKAATASLLRMAHAELAEVYAATGNWRRAAEASRSAIAVKPNECLAWLRAAPALALAGDEAAYREFCRDLLHQFRGARGAAVADRVYKICLLCPEAVDVSELPLERLREATAERSQAVYRPWFAATCALASYREGNAHEAVRWAERVDASQQHPRALALVIRAMAEQQLGRTEQARQTLAQAGALIPGELRTLGTDAYHGPLPVAAETISHDWLIPEILRREAAALID
ncbi:MAG TPA: WD40 repeat domain-containing protein, partial [Pirellulales bacterium]|nr:WD40 repeat domain-containing protein [Pirellulales bacterium]